MADSLVRGKPDNQSVDLSTRISALNEILDITSKAIIFDSDNGGRIEHLPLTINSMERQGVSAMVIEDKIGLKKNSLFKNKGYPLYKFRRDANIHIDFLFKRRKR